MVVFIYLIGALLHGAVVLLDFLSVLIVVRVLCHLRPMPVLTEFDHAARPLVDSALRWVTTAWHGLQPKRMLTRYRLFALTWIVCALARVVLAMLLAL